MPEPEQIEKKKSEVSEVIEIDDDGNLFIMIGNGDFSEVRKRLSAL